MIDGRYFEILQLSGFVISLQSKNTKHYWHICIEELGKIRHFKVYHKHNRNDEFHRHRDRGNFAAVLEDIKIFN